MTQHKNEEEVDVGSLFVIIGKGISKVIGFIRNIFSTIFHFLIQSLLFFKNNRIKLGVAFAIGAAVGLVVETKEENKYCSNLLVQTNFNSARQLYSNVSFYENLVTQQNFGLLAKIFNLKEAEAASLKKFIIRPIRNENDIIRQYDQLVLSVDTLTVDSYSFKEFKRAFTKFDYRVHSIVVQSTKNNIFSKLDDVIIAAIVENKYFNKLKELTNEDLQRTDELLRKNLKQTDSLHNAYKKAITEEAKSAKQGTTIDLGSEEKTTRELELFSTALELNERLKTVSREKSDKSEVVNIISNFQPIGQEIRGLSQNRAVQFGTLAFLVVMLFLLLKKLNVYLENYSRKSK